MKSRILTPIHSNLRTPDIYADKSTLVLQWLLLSGIEKETFSLREASTGSAVSLGLAQRVFEYLLREGYLSAVGVRTAKKFMLEKPKKLLTSWAEHYGVTNKCKIWNYTSAIDSRADILDALKRSSLWNQTCLALHSAAEFHGCKNTNLRTLELYVLDTERRPELERTLELRPQERGYEVLLIKPYYKAMLSDKERATLITKHKLKGPNSRLFYSPSLLTFLDLFNFPLRGREQAEFMAQRVPVLKRIFKGE